MRLPKTKLSVGFTVGLLLTSAPLPAEADDHNPVGTTGTFEGVITTGGSYNLLNHNATRQIDDLEVPGALGKYGLKMTRYYNSRDIYGYAMGRGWRQEYSWYYDYGRGRVTYPDGHAWENSCFSPAGVSDGWVPGNGGQRFRLADGGTVVFGTYPSPHPIQIIDPYGQTINITYAADLSWMTVTEPGGRYLHFIYDLALGLTRVEAHGYGNATVTDWVNYTYTSQPTGGQAYPNAMMLTRVDYSDGTSASYTYQPDNAQEDINRGQIKVAPLVKGANDVRYHGAMRKIAYEFRTYHPAHGDLHHERYWDGVAGNELAGAVVSTIDPPAPDPLALDPTFETNFTETRGDGLQRTFIYSSLHLHRFNEDICPTNTDPNNPDLGQQFLLSYTDFLGHNTILAYDANWYVNSVTNANGQVTSYLRGPSPGAYPGPQGIGEILRVTHPGGSHIDYTYQSEAPNIGGHFVTSVTDEIGHQVVYTRDATTHLVTRIDYPSDANTPASFEQFTYNSFGQLLTHRSRNGAWASFVYNVRGLLTDEYNPKQGVVPGGTDPHTHYTYYGPTWATSTDRVLTKTFPVNASGYAASETYEYDNGVSGRGLVTKITHADGTYLSTGYDSFGNKLWEENELRQRTSYTYDDYNRVLTVKNPLLKTLGYTYILIGGSSYKLTSNTPDMTTTPTGIVTKDAYDANFRKTSTTTAFGTALAATTTFAYDNAGNLVSTGDPLLHETLNTYDARNRKVATTVANGTSLAQTTTLHYDNASRVYQVDRPDGTIETKTFDAVNRALTDTVPQTASINLTTRFAYNPSGTIQQVTNARGDITSFTYDASDRKTVMTYPVTADTQNWNYDNAGNLANRVTVGGETQTFSYDNQNRLTGMSWSNNLDWESFGYDAAGRRTSANNPNSTVTRQYNAAGHLTADTQMVTGMQAPGVTIHYAQDDDGKTNRMWATGSGLGAGDYDLTYSYDLMGRFEKILATPSTGLFQYKYDAASNETERDNLLGTSLVNQYTPRDALNRITAWDVKKGATNLLHEGYTYDAMNRITQVAPLSGSADVFTYYLDGELKTANLPNLAHNPTYNLDKMGNRTSVVDGTTTTYTPNSMNEYTAVSGNTITNGSEHQISAFNGVTYVYINDEHLTQATIGTTTYSMAYDALGRSVKRSLTGGSTTYYIYDGEKPILEYDSTAPVTTIVGTNVYGRGIDEIIERVALGQTYYPQQNHEGSVMLLTNTSGAAIERYRFDAFGAPTVYTGTWGARTSTAYDNRFLFTGREYAATYRGGYNASFNFYEYRARAYNPTLGRFTSEDPKGFAAGDYNLFRYVSNDPINHLDPMGLEQGQPETLPPGGWTPGSVWRMETQKNETNAERLSNNAKHFDSGNMDQRPAGASMSGVITGIGSKSFIRTLRSLPDHSVKSLSITSHGMQYAQSLSADGDIGNALVARRDGGISITTKRGLVPFDERMARKFAEDSEIFLNGCETGREAVSLINPTGRNLAQIMSVVIPGSHVHASGSTVFGDPGRNDIRQVPYSVRTYVHGERVSGPSLMPELLRGIWDPHEF